MTTHISARVAWHMDGWNGHICKDPASNTYCVGCHSYPGEMIREKRNLAWEQNHAGQDCADLGEMPPCMYSVNAFGAKALPVVSDPPEWFGQGAQRRTWQIPPATVCIWPYEQMYLDEVRLPSGSLDHSLRLDYAKNFFEAITPNHSLIFYYANYSNPLTEEDEPRYVVVGMSRVKQVGAQEFYEQCSAEVQEKYAGGFVWQRSITSYYPDEGLRLPFHAYQDRPDVLEKLALFPDNPRNFKYGTRAFTDDEALNLVERFLEICGTLSNMGDTSENWPARIEWLQSLIAELWQGRGLYPGMATVLKTLPFPEAIVFWKDKALAGEAEKAKGALFSFLDKSTSQVPGLPLTEARTREIQRAWQLREDDERQLLSECFPRFALTAEQISVILSKNRVAHGIVSSLKEITANPYLLSEQFVGDGPDDILPFFRIDHGMFPSPDLGAPFLAEKSDWRRLRGLCVDQLRREMRHTFLPAADVIHALNQRLAYLPEWKRHQFTERYLAVDRNFLVGALTFRKKDGKEYIYLKSVYDAERVIEKQMRDLVSRPDIPLRSSVTAQHWHNYLFAPASPLAERSFDEYENAIQGQVAVCQRVFVRPVSVLSGSAGTGKTTVIKSLIQAVEKAHGTGTAFCLLAPTGKAADRIRSATGKDASTVHSFLARHGWLNSNMTFKASGGEQEDRFSTYIIDEASMLDLELAAALFRCIKWPTVQRLILVGDQSQLPPIGRGRLFADLMEWLEAEHESSVAVLETNIRQMANKIMDEGTGIQDLAAVYQRTQTASQDDGKTAQAEEMLRRLQNGGAVDKDLYVEFWNGADDLHGKLAARIIADMEQDTGQVFNPVKPYELWTAAFGQTVKKAEYQQVLSPYRGDEMGTEFLNLKLQQKFNGNSADRNGISDGIKLFDKVIQIRNHTLARPLPAFDTQTRLFKWVERFNGEIGFVKPHAFDGAKWKWSGFRAEHFQVTFSRKEWEWVGYGKKLGKDDKGRWVHNVDVSENLELAYAVSCHKAQGSEFERVYFVVPKHKAALLSREMFYTGLTRASRHCTLLVEEDITPMLTMYRPEASALLGINSSVFTFHPVPEALLRLKDWYIEGKVHQTLTEVMVRSKSEVIIANMLAERDIPFAYEVPLTAPDGTFYLPDFTVTWGGETYYWEHLGRLDLPEYRNHWETKQAWYEKNFPGRLLTTVESPTLSHDADALIQAILRGQVPPQVTAAVGQSLLPPTASSGALSAPLSPSVSLVDAPPLPSVQTVMEDARAEDMLREDTLAEDDIASEDAAPFLTTKLISPTRDQPLFRLEIYDGETYLGEYERSGSAATAVAKMEEVAMASDLLRHVFRAHRQPFVVRWNSRERQKEIRAGQTRDADVWGLIPASLWRKPAAVPPATPPVLQADGKEDFAADRRVAVSYEATRLTFLADKIESLRPDDVFRIVTPVGTFEMTKDDFDTVFDNVAESDSYQQGRVYHYPSVPRKALAFQINN